MPILRMLSLVNLILEAHEGTLIRFFKIREYERPLEDRRELLSRELSYVLNVIYKGEMRARITRSIRIKGVYIGCALTQI